MNIIASLSPAQGLNTPFTGNGTTADEANTDIETTNAFNFILKNALEMLGAENLSSGQPGTLLTTQSVVTATSTSTVTSTTTPLDDILIANQNILETLTAIEPGTSILDNTPSLPTPSIQTLSLNDQSTPSVADSFLIGTQASTNTTNDPLQRILNALNTLIEKSDSGLIVTNLKPDQLTALKSKIEALIAQKKLNAPNIENLQIKNGDIQKTTDDIINSISAGLIQILQPLPKSHQVITGQTATLSQESIPTSAPQNNTSGRVSNLSSSLNDISTGDLSEPAPGSSLSTGSTDNFDDFDSFLKQFSGNTKESKTQNTAQNANNVSNNNNSNAAQYSTTLQGWNFLQTGTLLSPLDFSQSTYDQFGISTAQVHLTSQGSMTALVTQAHSATQPHPATQLVAATIQKNANAGEDKNITLQLDPPELGRVEIKMSFDKDKAIKAIITAEKPETFLMMQRDAQTLERTLQDAGLDTSGGLSFELASDGHQFSQNGRHDESHSGARGKEVEDTGTIIVSSMTWIVNPDTGHMHYNIWA
jgi:hypothetical protein